jgi:hypothetical protein
MSEGVDKADIGKGKEEYGETPSNTVSIEKRVLGEIPIGKSVRRRYKLDGAGGIIETESEESVQK